MPVIIIYTKDYCPYCVKAKNLLKRKGQEANITEIDITHDEALQKEMIEKSGGRKTVPQIFIDGKHVGGSDDLYALDAAGKLNQMLSA
jgi:glutaredoxin 3